MHRYLGVTKFLGSQYFEIRFYIYQFKQTGQLSNVLLGWLTALFKYFNLNLQINANYKFNWLDYSLCCV